MEDYKRLTKRSDFGWFHGNCENCPSNGKCNPKGSNFFDCLEVFVDRLGELEDKIEQGLLVELPCKVGDKIFFVYDFGSVEGECFEIDEGTIDGISVQTECLANIHARYESGLTYWHREQSFGKNIFLTKAEAEAKLAELRG